MIGDFSEALKKAVNDLSALEEDSGKKVNSLVTGKLENVHDIMIAMEKSKIGLNMAIEVRNKLIEGYKEVMRMQV
jgi:flagellar hook-basal body complex protein FliE